MPDAPAAGRRPAAARLLGVAIVAALAVGLGTLIVQEPWTAAALPAGVLPTPTATTGSPLPKPSGPPAATRSLQAGTSSGADDRATRLSTFWGVDVSWP